MNLPIRRSEHLVWEDYVPIVRKDRVSDVYLTDNIDAPANYNELCHLIESAHPGDTINLHINNGGGAVDSAFMIIDKIKHSEATIVGKLSGTVASASTVLSLACDEIEVADYVQFMVHNYSGGAGGKGHEIKAYVTFSDKELNIAFREIYAGFLTTDEIQKLGGGVCCRIWRSRISL